MGNLIDALVAHATDEVFLRATADLIHRGYRWLDVSAPLPAVTFETHDGLTTLIVTEPQSPYVWRFWPDPNARCWLAEFRNTVADDEHNWTQVFRGDEASQHGIALHAAPDIVAEWIVALTGPEVAQ